MGSMLCEFAEAEDHGCLLFVCSSGDGVDFQAYKAEDEE